MTRPDDSAAPPTPTDEAVAPPNFIEEIVAADVAAGRRGGRVMTRFPPEPNGYLHIGHAKSICLNFGLAAKFGGVCNLRFDDTNPTTEELEFVESIQEDVRWLGFDWEDRLYFASDYFEKLHDHAVELIRAGKAYVDSQSLDAIREGRGDFHTAGRESPFRDRPVEESLDLFRRMRAGEFDEGAHVLRARIDMASGNQNLRDPLIYRIRKAPHHRTGTTWSVYPLYDFAHGLSDAVEGVTHSVCTLEFESHRPLYEWFLAELSIPDPPQQIEFARLNLSYTVLSKRKLQELVKGGHVSGWDDPRMPTLAGLRRRGVPPDAIRTFCERIGVARREGVVDVTLLEHTVREDLNARTPRVMAVLRPLKVVLDNFPEGHVEVFDAPLHPDDPSHGSRKLELCRELYIERDDFMLDPPKKFFRLAPGREVRLRYACVIQCTDVVKNEAGEVVEVHCTWDPESRGGTPADGRKVKSTLHWVSNGLPAEARLYDRLFSVESPGAGEEDFIAQRNPRSLELVTGCLVEPHLAGAAPGSRFQFERLGYFCVDRESSRDELVFNRTIGLRDSWAAAAKAGE